MQKKFSARRSVSIEISNAIKDNPNNVQLYLKRGNSFCSLGQYEFAKEDFKKVIELNPNYVDSNQTPSAIYKHLGLVYEEVQKYFQAIKNFTQAIELNLNDKYLYEKRGRCYEKIGEHEKAAEDFAKTNRS